MGLFDKIFNKLFNRKPKQLEQPKVDKPKSMYSMPTADGQEIMLFGVEMLNQIQHSDNSLTDLMVARVVKQYAKDTIYFDQADYIGFELTQGMNINDEIMNAVMNQYSQRGNEFIGRLMSDRNGYFFGNKSETVKNVFLKRIQEKIQEREKQRKESMEQNRIAKERREDEGKRARFLRDIDARESLSKYEEKRNRRKQSPTLEVASTPYGRAGGEQYFNFNGVNLETGDILRIRKVDKVGKDKTGTYLYSAYIENTPNESDVECLGETPFGFPVCFELPKRLEDIVRNGDVNEIRQVLELLSNGRNFENPDQLNYIGAIDRNGQVNRRAISSSPDIQAEIQKMKIRFAEKIKQQMEQQGRENY